MLENFLNYKKLNFSHTSTKNINLKPYKIYSYQTIQKIKIQTIKLFQEKLI